jgi:ribose-phosphate pyrophosphokinase
MTAQPPLLFALGSSRGYGERIAERLGIGRSAHQEQEYEDGEHKLRPDVDVQGRNVFVITSLYGEPTRSVHDKLYDLLSFIGALKDVPAERVTAIAPYLCYTRQDRRIKSDDPLAIR